MTSIQEQFDRGETHASLPQPFSLNTTHPTAADTGSDDFELIHQIGNRLTSGKESLDEKLSFVLRLSSDLVPYDSAFLYVLEEDDFALRAWRNSDPRIVEQLNLYISDNLTHLLTTYRVPISISEDGPDSPEFVSLDPSVNRPGESLVVVPLLSRRGLAGLLILHHKDLHAYSEREIRLLSTIGFLAGSEIEIGRLEDSNFSLLDHLETRKLVERGKGILQRELGINEEQAYLTLQRQSRQKRKSMREIAEAIILGDEVKRRSLAS